ncbi:HK97 gp10 family phage protein [Citrobacter freundii]|nr:HK97 gp10 family phage protein [Citrobacter freundii]
MGIKVKGIAEAKRNTNRIINEIEGVKAVRGVRSALMVGGLRAAYYTPIDTSTLINSQFSEVNMRGHIITGRVGYSANYAAYVHEMPGTLKGQPRAHFVTTREGKKFGGGQEQGTYWGTHGEPQFLKRGFEEERDAIDAVMRKELSL